MAINARKSGVAAHLGTDLHLLSPQGLCRGRGKKGRVAKCPRSRVAIHSGTYRCLCLQEIL